MNKHSLITLAFSLALLLFITSHGGERRNQARKARQTYGGPRHSLRSRQNMPIGRARKGVVSRSGEWLKEINQDEWETGNTYEFPTVRSPSRGLVLAGHRQMRIHYRTVPRPLCRSRRRRHTIRRIREVLVTA